MPPTAPRSVGLDVESWVAEGLIDYLGEADDVRPHIAQSDCVVLPSYREGLPRTLLEGAAMAKPLIATDVPGCRALVEHGINGRLCAVRDSSALAAAMLEVAGLSVDERAKLGAAGRAKVEAEFGEEKVARALSRRDRSGFEGPGPLVGREVPGLVFGRFLADALPDPGPRLRHQARSRPRTGR